MKKAVPLSLILATYGVQAQNYFSGTWVPSTTVSVNAAPQICCYYSGNVVIGGTGATPSAATVTGNADITTGGSTATGTAGPCGQYMAAVGGTTQISGAGLWTQTLGTAAAAATSVDNTVGSNTNIGATGATFSVDATGQTLTFRPSANTATANTVCTGQTLTRLPAQTTVSSLEGTWSVAAGTGTGTCCFLDTATNVVIATTSSKTTAVGKNGATNCASNGGNGASSTISLKTPVTGSAAATAGATATDIGGVSTFTLSADKSTITYVPGANCQQVLTKVSSSGVHLASIMTPVVVGGAMLGLVAV